MSMVDKYCNGCTYLGTISGGLYCAYNDVTGHMRGCRAGDGCTQRVPGGRKYNPSYYAIYLRKEPARKRTAALLTETEAHELEARRRREQAERNRTILHGRQKEAIIAFKESRGISDKQLADMAGVKESTIHHWISEYAKANWDKLAAAGMVKPEGLP